MNDTLSYFQTPPQMRTQHYHKLTFSMMYFYQERYLLPLSHDEVVHGKATILQKMHGDYEEKFPQARALYCYMMAHPGKKLNFMGNEIGQFREWDESREQDWNLLRYPKHDELFRFIRDLNHLYLNHSALWQEDDREQGFRWLDCHQEERCIYAMERRSEKERLVFVFNFSNQTQDGYQLPVEGCSGLRPILSTEWEAYGGGVKRDESFLLAQHNQVQLSLPPYSGLCLAVEGE